MMNYIETLELYATHICKDKLPKDVIVDELELLLDHIEEFYAICLQKNLSKSQIVLQLSHYVTDFGLVQKFLGDERDFGPDDFPVTAIQAVTSFRLLTKLLLYLEDIESSCRRHVFIDALFLCATHSDIYFWSSHQSVVSSKEFLELLLAHARVQHVGELLCDGRWQPTLLKSVLERMKRDSLTKDEWMKWPSSCNVFFWFLSNVKHLYLVDYIDLVFPPPFMFVSYHSVPQRVIGIKCFHYLLDNIAPTEMKLFGRQDVIFHNLFPLIYSKDLPIVQVLFPCLLKLPLMREEKSGEVLTWSKLDEVFHQLLFNFEVECDREAKRVYLSHILLFVDFKPPFKHLKHLMKLIKEHLNCVISPDIESQITLLKILHNIIQSSWPRYN